MTDNLCNRQRKLRSTDQRHKEISEVSLALISITKLKMRSVISKDFLLLFNSQIDMTICGFGDTAFDLFDRYEILVHAFSVFFANHALVPQITAPCNYE